MRTFSLISTIKIKLLCVYRNVVEASNEQALIFDPKEVKDGFFFRGLQQKNRDLLEPVRKNMNFTFDSVFPEDSDNNKVYVNTTKDLIEKLLDGCNCSVFVYGATGAGKTHTMLGNNKSPGIMFLTMSEMFRCKEELKEEQDFEMHVSYIEIYNENIQDLLKPGPPLNLREDSKMGVIAMGKLFFLYFQQCNDSNSSDNL